ncbi:MAG: hypothetical protein GYB21_17645 [Oceanospirillales bacterium]|nr:hypothetical protein [Oceanospirillales bacterium]
MNSSTDAHTAPWMRLLLIAALIAILIATTLYLPTWITPASPQGITLTPPTCDLNNGPCRLKQEGIALEFALTPTPIQSLATLNAQLDIHGTDIERATLSLEGRDMYMGLNQTELTATGNGNRWLGSTELAVCTTGRMVWRARLTLESKDRVYSTWFDFEAK